MKRKRCFNAMDFFYAKALFTGTLQECRNYDTYFSSTIPALLGLPPLEKNICEGIVAKVVDGSLNPQGLRLIFKKKNPKFAEINPECTTKFERERDEQRKAVDTIYDEVERYINENRLMSVKSKMIEEDWKIENVENISELLTKDIFKDFISGNGVEAHAKLWKLVESEDVEERIKVNTKSKVRIFVSNWMRGNK